MNKTRVTLQLLFLVTFPACMAFGQQRPDAGQTLQQQQQQSPQAPHTGLAIDIESPPTVATTPGGVEVKLTSLTIGGVSVFSEAELLSALGDFAGKSYDLAGLRTLAERINTVYRAAGYPFARAFVPQQPIAEGQLRIEVVEGRYGQVLASGDPNLVASATSFLAPLKPGALIEAAPLERIVLLLTDLPGIRSLPSVRAGKDLGRGDVDMLVQRGERLTGDIGLDNHGSRFTGEYRSRANLQWNSPFTFGDQLSVGAVVSDEGMWLGNLGYSLPLGSSGLRGSVGYSQTYYQLAKDFANLQASGTAKVSSVGLSYPLVRSQRGNLQLAATYQHKRLNDKQGLAGTDDDKSSDSLPISLSFDRPDGLWGGGTTYGSITYTQGRLALGDALAAQDIASGQNTNGSFDKWNLDIARIQSSPVSNLNLFGHISAQKAGKNMDSSEGFILGGSNGVRAYPTGEGAGDEGWLLQLEVRYTMGRYSPYIFHDSGQVRLNANNGNLTMPANPNNRSIAGEGLGLRYNKGNWNLDANLSWRSHGGQPLSDTADRNPRVWISAGYKF